MGRGQERWELPGPAQCCLVGLGEGREWAGGCGEGTQPEMSHGPGGHQERRWEAVAASYLSPRRCDQRAGPWMAEMLCTLRPRPCRDPGLPSVYNPEVSGGSWVRPQLSEHPGRKSCARWHSSVFQPLASLNCFAATFWTQPRFQDHTFSSTVQPPAFILWFSNNAVVQEVQGPREGRPKSFIKQQAPNNLLIGSTNFQGADCFNLMKIFLEKRERGSTHNTGQETEKTI